jgi:hypothetical protein
LTTFMTSATVRPGHLLQPPSLGDVLRSWILVGEAVKCLLTLLAKQC